MKLIACYTVFDATELLQKAIDSIAEHIDGVVICYQTVSNKGRPVYIDDMKSIADLQGDCIERAWYETDLSVNAKENERRKHTLMIDTARKMGATHFMMAATDHFYDPIQFGYAKEKALDYDSTFTSMYTYYKHPTWQIEPIEAYYMPLICKLYPETKIERVRNFPFLVDPSVQMNTLGKWYRFSEDEIMLHHYSMVRKDIERKFLNAASPWKPEDIERFVNEYSTYDLKKNPGIEYFKGRKVKEVPDYFGINSIFV